VFGAVACPKKIAIASTSDSTIDRLPLFLSTLIELEGLENPTFGMEVLMK
jgi:hypothetical protein